MRRRRIQDDLGDAFAARRSKRALRPRRFQPWAAIGDFNNDGKVDLAVATGNPGGNPVPFPQTQNVSMLPGDGAGRFGAAINSSAPAKLKV